MSLVSGDPDRVYTGRGLINDIEANLLKVCKRAFEENESLRFMSNYTPKEWQAQDGSRIARIEDLPALYTWCEGLASDTSSIGQSSGRALSHQTYFICNVRYMLPLVETPEADTTLKEIAWHLYMEIVQNKNLNGLIAGPANILDVDLKPDILRVGDKARQLSTVSIKVLYLYQQKTSMARK